MPITEQQLEEILASVGVYPVMRRDATGPLVKGYLAEDIGRACRELGLPPEDADICPSS
jgi:hypothetical protein